MSEYGKTLRKLIDFSGVKLYAVADKVGYDVSYISKWCNKDHLPAANMSQKINRTLADFLSSEILKKHNGTEEFLRRFSDADVSVGLDKAIMKMLQDSFLRSSLKTTHEGLQGGNPSHTSYMRILTHSNEIYNYICAEAPRLIKAHEGPVEILCTIDLCKYLDRSLSELSGKRLGKMHIRLAMNKENLNANYKDIMPKLYSFMSINNGSFIEIYEDSKLKDANLVVVKDLLAAFCSLDNNGRIISLFTTTDLKLVKQIYMNIRPVFASSGAILRDNDPIEFHRNGYRTDFYSKDRFQILLAHGFEFLLPKDCWQSVVQTAKEKYKNDQIALLVSRLQITWEEIFERGSIDFFLLKTSVFRYIETGEIIFTDVVYRLTPAQRKSHLHNVIECCRRNPNIIFYLIDDEKIPVKGQTEYMSVFNNRMKAFIKNPARYKNDSGPFFYSILSDEFIGSITRYLDELKESSHCSRFDAEALLTFYDKYSTLINRMIDL